MAYQKKDSPNPPVKNPKPIGDVKKWMEELRQEGVIGMWADREDMKDSAAYVRNMRQEAASRYRRIED